MPRCRWFSAWAGGKGGGKTNSCGHVESVVCISNVACRWFSAWPGGMGVLGFNLHFSESKQAFSFLADAVCKPGWQQRG